MTWSKIIKKLFIKYYLYLIIFMVAVVLLCYGIYKSRLNAGKIYIPTMDVVVESDNTMLGALCGMRSSYPMDFVRIKAISFALYKEDLFIRYDLAGKLPKKDELPKYKDDKLTGVVYFLDLGGHYFDNQGNKNQSGLDVNVKMSFYGKDKENKDDSRLTVQGKLVAGGPGNNYFISRFPYRKLIYSQNSPYIVFGTSAVAVSKKYGGGASRFDFENKSLAVGETHNQDIKIKLGSID